MLDVVIDQGALLHVPGRIIHSMFYYIQMLTKLIRQPRCQLDVTVNTHRISWSVKHEDIVDM